MATTVTDAKQALRRDALTRRKTMQPLPGAAATARDNLVRALDGASPDVVSGYVAMRGELDPLPALLALESSGSVVTLPYTVGKGLPLRFLAAPGGGTTDRDAFGIAAPSVDATEHDPGLLIVPLAAFDRRGYRMGYGGGFYDAALTRLRAVKPVIAVGWAFATQEVEEVPTEPHDARLDWIVTEQEAIYISG